jgi:hypothetical protein
METERDMERDTDKSDHDSIFLPPSYRQKLKQEVPHAKDYSTLV